MSNDSLVYNIRELTELLEKHYEKCPYPDNWIIRKHARVRAKESIFTDYMKKTISIRDTFVQKPTKENFYHGLLLGILGFKENWSVMSNRESGDGFSDILIRIEDEDVGIVIEVKYASDGNMEKNVKMHFCRSQMSDIQKLWNRKESIRL